LRDANRPSVSYLAGKEHDVSAHDDERSNDVLRARRIELIDAEGRPRLLLGDLGRWPGGGELIGVSLRDEHGHERLLLGLDALGPSLAFVEEGNVVLHLAVDDAAPGGGASLSVADNQGRPLARLWLDHGELRIQTEAPPGPG
jgi:hypothetical protein